MEKNLATGSASKTSFCFRCLTLIDYGITNDSEKFVTEICIPVKCE